MLRKEKEKKKKKGEKKKLRTKLGGNPTKTNNGLEGVHVHLAQIIDRVKAKEFSKPGLNNPRFTPYPGVLAPNNFPSDPRGFLCAEFRRGFDPRVPLDPVQSRGSKRNK